MTDTARRSESLSSAPLVELAIARPGAVSLDRIVFGRRGAES